ncbi:MAG: hypothetical protein AAF704_13960 [Cyanobacteria bacterium P01_D01_bin.123]
MSNTSFWQCVSVAEFCSRCNWEGAIAAPADAEISVSDTVFAAIGSSRQLGDRELLCLSVRDFFGTLNWKDAPAIAPKGQFATGSAVSPLTLSVSHFIQCIDWEGMPEVGATPLTVKGSKPPADTSMSATDFQDLF